MMLWMLCTIVLLVPKKRVWIFKCSNTKLPIEVKLLFFYRKWLPVSHNLFWDYIYGSFGHV